MNDTESRRSMAQNIQRLVSESGKTRYEICKQLGVNYSTFTEWYNGKKYPRIEALEKMAAYFGCTVVDLVDEPSSRKSPEEAADEDFKIITLYHQLSARDKALIVQMMESMIQRS